MKTNLREGLTRYRCFIRPKVHFAPEFSFNYKQIICVETVTIYFQDSLINKKFKRTEFDKSFVTLEMSLQSLLINLTF